MPESTYFVTAGCYCKTAALQTESMANLLRDTLQHYRAQKKYLLHEFVVMPNHIHLLITPTGIALERAMQFIKGGFSHRALKELGSRREIWQTSFQDHRVRDGREYQQFRIYIHQNPVKRGLCVKAEDFPYSSASPNFTLDPVPQRLKPISTSAKMQG